MAPRSFDVEGRGSSTAGASGGPGALRFSRRSGSQWRFVFWTRGKSAVGNFQSVDARGGEAEGCPFADSDVGLNDDTADQRQIRSGFTRNQGLPERTRPSVRP